MADIWRDNVGTGTPTRESTATAVPVARARRDAPGEAEAPRVAEGAASTASSLAPEQIQSHAVYCAEPDSRILAFYSLSRDGDGFELEHMWVDPEHMRAGLGTRLFRHAVELVRSMGRSSLRIASDPNAEPFYLRLGARRVGVVPSKPAGRELPLLVVDVVPDPPRDR